MNCPACHTAVDEDAAFCPHCGTPIPDAPAYDDFLYSAFISYRHRPQDASLAERLHTALETYRLPRGIAGPEVKDARAHHLGRVFRDKDELVASESLPVHIREALKHSSALVVICTPSTPESSWVAQEIELFASFHGRDRIFLALAEGEPEDSVPPLLLRHTLLEPDGTARSEPAEPLAADFRPDSKGNDGASKLSRRKFALEKLRIIAGIVGCGFDDLRRRERKRHGQRMAEITAGAAVAVLVVAGLAGIAANNHEQAQIEESKTLASQAQAQFAQGDRYGAIETALSALPNDEEPNRPVTDEATSALASALEVRVDSSTCWRNSYRIDMPSDIADIAYDPHGKWFALLDTSRNLNIYDTVTGHLRASNRIPQNKDVDQFSEESKEQIVWRIEAGDNVVIAMPNLPGVGSPICYDAKTGKVRWSFKNANYCQALACSEDGSKVCVLSCWPTKTHSRFAMATLKAKSGKLVDTQVVDADDDYPNVLAETPCTVSDTGRDVYFAVGSSAWHIDLASNRATHRKLSRSTAQSLKRIGNRLYVVSANIDKKSSPSRLPYAIDAFDLSLKPLWSKRSTCSLDQVNVQGKAEVIPRAPLVHGSIKPSGKEKLVVTAGSDVMELSPKTGRVSVSFKMGVTVVGTENLSSAMRGRRILGDELLHIALADGRLSSKGAGRGTGSSLDATEDVQLPTRIENAEIVSPAPGYDVVLASSADDKSKLIAYHTDYTPKLPSYAKIVHTPNAHLPNPEKQDYSLEELVSLAHEELGK